MWDSIVDIQASVGVDDIMHAVNKTMARDIAEHHGLVVIDPDNPADPAAMAWAAAHGRMGRQLGEVVLHWEKEK